jgi:ABC-type Fe3+-hydroxamate transport system substrate-binding protein
MCQYKRQVSDSLGRKIEYLFPPKKIISLVPSITELLFDLGLEQNIIARTRFCIHPKQIKSKLVLGGTKNIKTELIQKLKPDIIFAEKSENEKENILKIAQNNPVFVFDVHNFDGAIDLINTIGELTNTKANARILSDKIIEKFIDLPCVNTNKTVFYPIWKNPFFSIGGNTFISSMLQFCGLKNIFFDEQADYPKINIDQAISAQPDVIFLPSEPYKFRLKDKNEMKKIFPKSDILFVDGEMFAWYGSRMLKSADYFNFLCKIIYNKL